MAQLLVLVAWAALWRWVGWSLENAKLDSRLEASVLLFSMGAVMASLFVAARAWFQRLLTATLFAVAQTGFIAFLVTARVILGPKTWLGNLLSFLAWREPVERELLLHPLFFLLVVATLAVAWKRRPYRPSRIGFLMVHLAPLCLLLGGIWNEFGGLRAHTELRAGETTDLFHRVGADLEEPVPVENLQVHLESFQVRAREERLYARVPAEAPDPVVLVPKEGLSRILDPGDLRLEVEKLIPEAEPAGRIEEDPKGAMNPVLRVLLGLGLPEPPVVPLFSRNSACRCDEPGGRFAVLFKDSLASLDLGSLKPRPPRAEELVMSFQGRILEHDLQQGTRWQTPAFVINVTRLLPDFAIRKDGAGNPEVYTRSREPKDPWVEADLEVPGAGQRHILLSAKQPEVSDRLIAPNLPAGMKLRYVREGEETQHRFVIFTLEDRRVRSVESGRVVHEAPWALDRVFVIEPGLSVTPVLLLEHAKSFLEYVPSESGSPAIHVKLTDPRTGVTEAGWLGAGAPPSVFLGRRISLVLRAPDPESEDYRSTLVLQDRSGRELARGAVSVRDPLVFGSYRFFQGGQVPLDPALSDIVVLRQPGSPFRVAAGALLIIGSIWMFYLKGPLKRREREGAP